MVNRSMDELVKTLNQASYVYYNTGNELMSNKEWDQLYNELLHMENETGVVLPDSPTQHAGYTVVSKLRKVKHEFPALSLDKTKDITEFPKVFDVNKGTAVVMWKMDGSTVVATYDDGKLTLLATRGNGEEGVDITHNAPYIKGLPMNVNFKGHLVVRGEAVMSYKEFDRINAMLPAEEQYKNPRNLANATISLMDSKKMAEREIWFHAFDRVYVDNAYMQAERPFFTVERQFFAKQLAWLQGNGFNVVEHKVSEVYGIIDDMEQFSAKAGNYEFPVDGLVVAANDRTYALAQPGTGHNPNKLVGYAFKWADEEVETTLREIEWSPSRTGLLNPVAIFDPVELEGTTVSRASVHNVSIVKQLQLRIGDKVTVFKANKIIPQISKNISMGGPLTYDESHPVKCPICGAETNPIISDSGAEVSVCPNPKCPAKMVGKFVHFCERDCLNIEGMSEATLETFIDAGFIHEFSDLFHLDRYKDEIVVMDGFGEKSYQNIVAAAERARNTSFVPFIHALGIPNIGKGQAKLLNTRYHGDVRKLFDDAMRHCTFRDIDGIGDVLEKSLWDWADMNWNTMTAHKVSEVERLMNEVVFDTVEASSAGDTLAGKTFVITGDVHIYKNRAELQAKIESLGGKTSGSVSSKTSYLINNDVTSTSGKNKKAKELGIPIISEEQFQEMIGE